MDSFRTVGEMVEAQMAGDVTSVELLDACVRQIELQNPQVNAVVTTDLERAYEQAKNADAALARGSSRGPLHGVPFTVKDAIRTSGIRSTGGAEELSSYVPRSDAPAVASLRAAGAVLFGKTNTPKWCADIQTSNTLFGTTQNPWNLAHTCGGSSGGAAAAVATGMSGFDLGTDIGGSIRIPASYCGVYGHKPSFGVVPQGGYLDHPGGGTIDADVNVFGPIARSIADLSTLFDVLARPDPDNAIGWRLDLPAAHATALSELRVGIWLDDSAATVAREVKDVFDASVAALEGAGARLTESHPDFDLAHAYEVYAHLVLAAASLSRPADEPPQITHTAWLELTKHRAGLRQRWTEWFHDFDVLLCPVMPMAPFPHDLERPLFDRVVSINGVPRSHMETTAWTGMVGVAYLPSTIVRAGRTQAGQPVGLQVVGQYLHDRTTLRAARLIDEVHGPWEPPPSAGHKR